LIAA
jgi:hypothetical protein